MSDQYFEHAVNAGRRAFLSRSASGLGSVALASLLARDSQAAGKANAPGVAGFPDLKAKAKRVIYLFQSGAPSQIDLFDEKPALRDLRATELPDSIRQGQRLTGMTSKQESFPVAPSMFQFKRHGESGANLSELLPHTAKVADDLCIVRSMFTEAINHDPAITFFQTGFQLAGRPSIGSWLSYGLGSDNDDLPAFVAMASGSGGQPLYDRLWGSGFLPTKYQGVRFRSVGDPVLFLSNPKGVDATTRRRMLDDLTQLNTLRFEEAGDPEITTRIAQYEMAYRMQAAMPEAVDISTEPKRILDMYGPQVTQKGTFASNCLMARRLAERGVKFIQLMHSGWDQHSNLPTQLKEQCVDTDQPSAALVKDLKQRGLLEDTLVIWGGEFGRTPFGQGDINNEKRHGRDHHPYCYSIWMAGGGVKKGVAYGETDEYGYNVVSGKVHVHDLQATLMHLLGVDHKRLTFKFQGRHYRLTDVHGEVVDGVLA